MARVTQFVASSLPLNEFPGLSLEAQRLPRHVAIVMDGNGRWARQHGLSRPEGHRRGKDSVRAVVEAACEIVDRYRRLTIPVQAYMAVPARDHGEITAAALSGQTGKATALLKRHIDDIVDIMVAEMPRRSTDRATG